MLWRVSLLEYENKEVPLFIREDEMRKEKGIIARQAAEIIKDGDTVFMDASSTVLQMIRYLNPDKNITVITNSIKAIVALSEKHITAYCTGGKVLDNSLAFIGSLAQKTIENVNADIMFFSSQGLSADGYITDFSESETHLRQIMLKQAQRRCFYVTAVKLENIFVYSLPC